MNAPNHTRESFKSAVESTVKEINHDYQIRGSIAGGEFYLHDGTSFSDVDLIFPGVSEDARYELAEEVHQALLAKYNIDLPVFIQPADNFFSLNQSDSRLVALGEYLRKLRAKQPKGEFADFLLAKASLMIANENPGQRYTQIANTIDTPAAQLALAVKLGSETVFSPEESAALINSVKSSDETDWFKKVVLEGKDKEATDWVISELPDRPTIPDWLKQKMKQLLQQ
jgi:hypothetical protein